MGNVHQDKRQNVVPSEKFIDQMQQMPIGAFWATLRADPWTKKTLVTGLNPELSTQALNELQTLCRRKNSIGIPFSLRRVCSWHMAIGTTVFPTSIGQASTWNRALIEKMGASLHSKLAYREHTLLTAYSRRGKRTTLVAYGRNIRRRSRFEWHIRKLIVKGLQGNRFDDGKHVFSTLKHFAAYGIPLGGHNGQKAQIGTRELFSDHLLPFKMAIEAGARTIMTSYNAIDGIPCTANPFC
jgi:beta-glucosidase